jgi:hypothetical protein
MFKKLIGMAVAAIILLGVLGLTGCSEKASKYTEEEHIQRVTERIQKRFIDTDLRWVDREQPTSVEVFPLYDENDELKFFLVEFEPCGFIFVDLLDKKVLDKRLWPIFGKSMYSLSNYHCDWSQYVIDETNSQPHPDTNKIWKTDNNGDKVVFNRSPYFVADIKNEKRYLLCGQIAAIKQEGAFKNLISGDEVEIVNGQATRDTAVIGIQFMAFKRSKDYL